MSHVKFRWIPSAAATLVMAIAAQRSVALPLVSVPGDFPTIQAALNAASDGDTILVGPGTYAESPNFGGKAVALRSLGGPSATTIAMNNFQLIQLAAGAEISGFTLAGCCGGVNVAGAGALIKGNVFDGSTDPFGGLYVGGNLTSPTIDGNVFRNHSAPNGSLQGAISFSNNSSPLVINNIFENIQVRAVNLSVPVTANPRVINNTFVGNAVAIRVDRRVNSRNYEIRNNVIVGNGIGLKVDFGTEANNPTWENNLVFGNTVDYDMISNQDGMNGNLALAPLFANPAAGDYRLMAGSPAIDAGSPSDAPMTDFLGVARPQDGNLSGVAQMDIGAYEFVVPEPPGAPLAVAFTLAAAGAFRTRRVMG